MAAGAFCGVAPFLFRKIKVSNSEAKARSETSKTKNNNTSKSVRDNMKPSKVISNSCGVAGNFITMTDLRNKISTFRDLLDFSPCVGSASVNELLIWTMNDLFKRYPNIKQDVAIPDVKGASMHKALKIFCDALKSLGDLWTRDKWMVKCKYNSSMKVDNVDLEKIALALLEDIIKVARERLFDEMDEDEEMRDYSPAASAFGKALSESYSSDNRNSFSGSPATPTSVLPGSWTKRDKSSYSPPRLLTLRVQAVGKLNPIDVKRLSFHIFPRNSNEMNKMERERESEVKVDDVNKVNDQDDDMMGDMERVNEVSQDEMNVARDTERKSIDISHIPMPIVTNVQSTPFVPPPPPLPPPSAMSREMSFSPPPPPPPPPMAFNVPPPPPPMPHNGTPPPLPPPMSLNNAPPPPMTSRNGTSPPPPPPMGAKGPPPPPPRLANGAAPPPPPGFACLRPKKATNKLKRSPQMGNLYRLLKEKVEGSNSDGKSSSAGRKGKVGAPSSGGKQGMADALAEMTKRSAYFQQIEEDVKNYAGAIKEVKTKISAFQTSDMAELAKFHKYVESHLEKLTDETQVLARFEDFPGKKLEALRMAAALHSKLDAIAKTLQNWTLVSPVGQLLDKAEGYFNKIKVELDAMERTKDEEAKKFQAQKITFDFGILVRIKELMVDVSSSCMELALKEKREAKAKENGNGKNGSAKVLWRAFQFAFRVYTFAGGHDDRADKLTRELAQEIETEPPQ